MWSNAAQVSRSKTSDRQALWQKLCNTVFGGLCHECDSSEVATMLVMQPICQSIVLSVLLLGNRRICRRL